MSKILIIAYMDPINYQGGMEIVVKKLALGLKKNHEIVLCFQGKETKEFYYEGIKCYQYKMFPMFISERMFAIYARNISDLVNPDLVIDNTCVSFLNDTKKHKTISIIHGTSYGNYLSIKVNSLKTLLAKIYRYFWVLIQKYYLRKCCKVIAISDKMKEEIHNYYDIDNKNIHIIENGTFIVLSDSERQNIINKKNANKIIFVSTNHIRKGIKIIEKIALIIKSITFEVYGYDYKSKISNIIYKGLENEEGLKNAMMDSDIFILPSQYEGQSLAILDALAVGLPVITSKQAHPGIMKNNINGFIIDNNYEEYIDKINKIYSDINKLKNIRENNIKLMEKYTWDIQISKYLKFIDELL